MPQHRMMSFLWLYVLTVYHIVTYHIDGFVLPKSDFAIGPGGILLLPRLWFFATNRSLDEMGDHGIQMVSNHAWY